MYILSAVVCVGLVIFAFFFPMVALYTFLVLGVSGILLIVLLFDELKDAITKYGNKSKSDTKEPGSNPAASQKGGVDELTFRLQ